MGTAVSETAMAADGPRGTGSAAAALERREILQALRLLRRGDFSVRLPMDLTGVDGEIACAFNEVVELNAMKLENLLSRRQAGETSAMDYEKAG